MESSFLLYSKKYFLKSQLLSNQKWNKNLSVSMILIKMSLSLKKYWISTIYNTTLKSMKLSKIKVASIFSTGSKISMMDWYPDPLNKSLVQNI